MIDTIKFKICLSDNQYRAVQSKGKEEILNNKTLGTEIKRRYKDTIYLPSFDYHLNYWCDDKDSFWLEFSIPKYLYGHNIYLLYASELEMVLTDVFHDLNAYFGDFPTITEWNIYRLDVSYAWKYETQAVAEKVLSSLKLLEYPRKKRNVYKTGVMWIGEKYSPKFYLKYQDFQKHDFKRWLKHDQEQAYKLLQLAEGVLRFEVTMRRFTLDFLFENKQFITYVDLLKNNFLLQTLTHYLNILTSNFDKGVINDIEIARRLISSFGKIKGMRRYYFYELYFSAQVNKRHVLNNIYSRATIWRYKKDLAEANISILPLFDISADIHIPSIFVVNPDPAAVVLTTGRQDHLDV